MPLVATAHQISREQYLAGETPEHVRHEYLAGIRYAMDGMNPKHQSICQNLVGALQTQLIGQSHSVFHGSMKLRIDLGLQEIFYYPDILVTTGGYNEQKGYCEQANVLVEVVSPSTALVDRREKLLIYRQHSPLAEYILIDQDYPAVAVYRRSIQAWKEELLGASDILHINTLGIALTVRKIYQESGTKNP